MFIEASTVGPSSAIIPSQLSAAVLIGYVMWLLQKAKSIPFISQATTKLNIILRLIASTGSSIGISFAWQPANNHSLIISGLTLSTVIVGLYHLAVQYATTHGFEKLMNILPSTSVAGGSTASVVPTTDPAPSKN